MTIILTPNVFIQTDRRFSGFYLLYTDIDDSKLGKNRITPKINVTLLNSMVSFIKYLDESDEIYNIGTRKP